MGALGLLTDDLEYHVLRGAMVIIFLFFGYTKWHQYAAQLIIPFISNSPILFWLYPAFGIRGGARFLGASEWIILALLYAGFWDKRFGVLGALGSTITFITTLTIIPFVPNGWDPAAGFPAMAGLVPFLMKDLVLLTVSLYLLKQDVMRMLLSSSNVELRSWRGPDRSPAQESVRRSRCRQLLRPRRPRAVKAEGGAAFLRRSSLDPQTLQGPAR